MIHQTYGQRKKSCFDNMVFTLGISSLYLINQITFNQNDSFFIFNKLKQVKYRSHKLIKIRDEIKIYTIQ
jgi:hypothetical protein